MMRSECDKCNTKIYNGKCGCGFWYEKDSQPNILKTFERAIYAFDYMCEHSYNQEPMTADHHSGNCLVLFKGTYEDTQKVKEFILDMKKDE